MFECDGCHLMHCDEHKVTLSGDEFCPGCVRGIIDDMASELGDQEIASQERAQFAALLLAASVTTEEAAAIDRWVN